MKTTQWAKPFKNNDYRRTLAVAWVSWCGVALFAVLRAYEVISQSFGSFGLLFLGAGVASSLALSRYRLTTTFTQVLQVGFQSAISLSANVFTDTCIMVLDRDGKVSSVDHEDAIGWSEEELVGRELVTILAPRSRGLRVLRPGTSMTSPMQNERGEVFDARLSFAALHTDGPGDNTSMIVTVSPIIFVNPSTEGGRR